MREVRLPGSARLEFRLWGEDDLDLALGLWGDPRVTALIGGPFDESQVRAMLAEELEQQRVHGVQYWPVFLPGGEHVGCCGLRPHGLRGRRVYELGFHLRPAHWGRGLAGEGAAAVVDFAFTELGAAALFAGHHPENAASRRLLLRVGFRHTHDELYPPTGQQHPSYLLESSGPP